MSVTTSWTSPLSGTIDLSNGTIVAEVNWGAVASGLYRLGGTDGNAKTGKLQIGSTQAYSNANCAQGLTINQDANDDEILAMKSSDVAHGMTGLAETDTFGHLYKAAAAGGGLVVRGLDDGGGLTSGALTLWGVQGQAADTTHSAAGFGIVRVAASVKSGTGGTNPATNANLFSIDGHGVTRFIVDADGDYFSDGIGGTYDDWDDMALVQSFDVRDAFGRWRAEHRPVLVAAGILAPDDAEGNPGFVNWTNLLRLHNGALRELAARHAALEARLARLPG